MNARRSDERGPDMSTTDEAGLPTVGTEAEAWLRQIGGDGR